MLRSPKTLRKYQDAELTQEASNVSSSIPCCSIGLKRRVSGNGTLAAEKKEKVQNHAQLPLENSVISVMHRFP